MALFASPLLAFDNDYEINDINLNEENFLDIKAHRFRKSLEYQWYDNVSAWRITGASLDGDLAFVQNELKLQSELSDYLNVRLEMQQEVFYASKPVPLPTAEVEIYPWAGNLGFSLLGTPAYEKSDMDLGFALIWGRRPWNYTRLEYLNVDAYYNQKNAADNTFYRKAPSNIKLEGYYEFAGHYKLRYTLQRERPLERVDPDRNALFTQKGDNYFLQFDYLPVADTVYGASLSGFSLDKTSSQSGQDLQQATDYISADIYWVKGMGKRYEFRLGSQYDYIKNNIRDYISSTNNLNYFMTTLQIYGTVYHPFNEHMGWDLGLHIGDVEERQTYLQDSSRNTVNDSIEAKLRMGFVYTSADGNSTLQFNLSINADDPINDPGDGGGISFQSVF